MWILSYWRVVITIILYEFVLDLFIDHILLIFCFFIWTEFCSFFYLILFDGSNGNHIVSTQDKGIVCVLKLLYFFSHWINNVTIVISLFIYKRNRPNECKGLLTRMSHILIMVSLAYCFHPHCNSLKQNIWSTLHDIYFNME